METKIKKESGIKALFMSFINPSSEELMKAEEIMKSNKILSQSLKEIGDFENKFFKDYTSVRKPNKKDIPQVKLNGMSKELKEQTELGKDIDDRSK